MPGGSSELAAHAQRAGLVGIEGERAVAGLRALAGGARREEQRGQGRMQLGRVGVDALNRRESCGGHFREESQTPEGEALRNDDDYSYVAAWEFAGVGEEPNLIKEPLEFEYVQLAQRSYK